MVEFTELQLSDMQHAIGYSEKRVRGRKYRRYSAWRNRYTSNGYLKHWDDLVQIGMAGCKRQPDSAAVLYWVTDSGLAALSDVLGVTITEED